MGWFKKALGTVVKVAAPVAIAAAMPESMVNTAIGTVVKHKTKLDNQKIPGLNFLMSSAVAFGRRAMAGEDMAAAIMPSILEGGMLMGASTGLHQTIKTPLKQAVTGDMAARVGPGRHFSF